MPADRQDEAARIEQQEQLDRRDPGQRQETPEDHRYGPAPWIVLIRPSAGLGPQVILISTIAALRAWVGRQSVSIIPVRVAEAAPAMLDALRAFTDPGLDLGPLKCHAGMCRPDQCVRCRRVIDARNAVLLAEALS